MKYLLVILFITVIKIDAFEQLEVNVKESSVGFSIIKFKIGMPVEGEFNDFHGKALFDYKNKIVKNLDAIIFTPSIDTDNKKRDRHLLNKNFFYAYKYPIIRFKSIGPITLKDQFQLQGEFTIRGVTKNITLDATTILISKNKIIVEGTTTINRLDYGISWNKTLEKSKWKKVLGILGKTALDNKVTLKLKITAQTI